MVELKDSNASNRTYTAEQIVAKAVKLVKLGRTNRQIYDRLQRTFLSVRPRTTWAIICAAHYDIEQERH